jgi:geranylgeranyl diphosphate synthase, type II
VKDYDPLRKLFKDAFDGYLAGLDALEPRELYESQRYFLSLGGKRIRPLLALIGCDLFDAHPEKAIPSALAVELFHNFSLIHDDILDEAPLRRGQETVHRKYSLSTAILSGDAMLIQALRCLDPHPAVEHRKLSSLLCRTATQVCEGQQLDMAFEKRSDVSVKEYVAMITGKTAVLLGCALRMGAISGRAGRVPQEWLYETGKHLGIAFQLTDDLLDAYADTDSGFGKQTGGDIIANKKTFLLLNARELASRTQRDELDRLMSMKGNDEERVRGVIGLFDELKVRENCQAEADRHTDAAIGALSRVRADAGKKERLRQLCHDMLFRKI